MTRERRQTNARTKEQSATGVIKGVMLRDKDLITYSTAQTTLMDKKAVKLRDLHQAMCLIQQ